MRYLEEEEEILGFDFHWVTTYALQNTDDSSEVATDANVTGN